MALSEPVSCSIAVITLTRGRPRLVRRAIASVQAQVCDVPVHHLVLVDDCAETARSFAADEPPPGVEWRLVPRERGDRSGPGRSSRLRNHGVQVVPEPWIAFLDDDNEWRPDHLQTLIECALGSGVRAVHSWLCAVNPDGTPYLEQRSPWARDPEEGRRLFAEMVRRGVYSPGSNVFRDRADPLGHPDPVRSVDTGAWLLARELLLEVPFRDDFTAEDAAGLVGEDDKLLGDLIERRETIVCSRRATLIYYLGGYSNAFDRPQRADFAWI